MGAKFPAHLPALFLAQAFPPKAVDHRFVTRVREILGVQQFMLDRRQVSPGRGDDVVDPRLFELDQGGCPEMPFGDQTGRQLVVSHLFDLFHAQIDAEKTVALAVA